MGGTVKILTIVIPIHALVDLLSHTTIYITSSLRWLDDDSPLKINYCLQYKDPDCNQYPILKQLLYFIPIVIEVITTMLTYAPIFFSLFYGNRVIFALGVIMLITNMVKQGHTLVKLLLNFELIADDGFIGTLFGPYFVDVLHIPFYFVLGGFYFVNIALPAGQLKW